MRRLSCCAFTSDPCQEKWEEEDERFRGNSVGASATALVDSLIESKLKDWFDNIYICMQRLGSSEFFFREIVWDGEDQRLKLIVHNIVRWNWSFGSVLASSL